MLIAALVVARGAVVPFADLKNLMWPSGEPASAANQLHRLIGQARRVLEPDLPPRDAGVFIIGSNAGYRLDVRRVRSDLEDLDTVVARARRLGHDEEWDAATDEYVRGLGQGAVATVGRRDVASGRAPRVLRSGSHPNRDGE